MLNIPEDVIYGDNDGTVTRLLYHIYYFPIGWSLVYK